MGKWDHRPSRRFFRRQRSPVPPPKYYNINAPLPEFSHDGIPLWEKKYCTLIGSVPWQKIVDSKKDIYSHSNVLNWNDSGAEESFQNSKNQYWARINNLYCDISLPHPDMYVDRIDWNPCIDPELIKEIDSAYFPVPGDCGEEQENAIKFKRAKILVNDENPWECTGTPSSRAVGNKAEGCNQGDSDVSDSGIVDNTDNPWERNITHGNEGSKDNPWEGGLVKSQGWNEGRDHTNHNHSGDWNSGCRPWGNDCTGILSHKDTGWGKIRDSSWCQKKSNDSANISNLWECEFGQQNVTTPGKMGWRNNGANVSGWRNHGENTEVSSSSQPRRNYAGRTSWNQTYQKREGCNQQTFGRNGSHYRRDDRHTDHNWRWETSKKRDFAH